MTHQLKKTNTQFSSRTSFIRYAVTNRCPKDVSEFVNWCNKYSLSQGGLEGLKSLKFWPDIYKEFKIKNNNCSMINLIYLCFNANSEEKKKFIRF